MNIRFRKFMKMTIMMATVVAITNNIIAAKDTKIGNLKFERTLENNKSIYQNKVQYFNLDEYIYSQTLDNFADMRLLDQNNNMIPFVVSKQTEKIVIDDIFVEKAKIISFKNDTKNNKVQLILKAPKIAKLTALKITGNNENNFEKIIIIYGSNDNKKYFFIDGGKNFYKHSNIANLHKNTIKLETNDKKNAYRYYKLIIENVFEKQLKIDYQVQSNNKSDIKQTTTRYNFTPFSISSVQLFFYKYGKKDKVVEYPIILPISSTNRTNDLQKNYQKKVTILDITTNKQPLKYFTFTTSTKNYNRYYELFAVLKSDVDKEKLVNLGNGYISESILNKHAVAKRQISINTSKRYIKYRWIIYNMNNTPLKDIKLKYYGYCYGVKFLSEDSAKLKLLYGCNNTKLFQQFPCYDISNNLVKAPMNNGINYYKLNKKVEKNNLFNAVEIKKNNKIPQWLIWAVIISTAFFLILILIKVAKHDDGSFSNDEEFPL